MTRPRFKVGDRIRIPGSITCSTGRVLKVGEPLVMSAPEWRRYTVRIWNFLEGDWMTVEVYENWLELE